MPQLVLLFGVGAGLVAGYKWLSREVQRHAEAAEAVRERNRQAQAGAAARDLGALEWDEATGAYRPKQH